MLFLAAMLAGCLPVASLQTAEPVSGSQVSLGLTAVAGASANGLSVGALPYLACAWGNGNTEFSLSTRAGLRGAVKQKLAPNFSVAGGLTIPWLIFSGNWGDGLPFTADAAMLYDATPKLTLALRGMYAYLGAELGNALAGG
ncbi:hypothetical protein [Oceanithermus sp.]